MSVLGESALARRTAFPGPPRRKIPAPLEASVRIVLGAPEASALAEHLDREQKDAAARIRITLAERGSVTLEMPRADALELAMQLHRTGKTDAAECCYRGVLAVFPADANARHYLGILLHQTERRGDGMREVERSMTALGREPWAWNNLGNLHKTAADGDRAAVAYRKALALDPDFVDALNNLGTVCRAESQWEEADRHYARAIALRPGFAAAHLNRGHLQLARRQLEAAVESLTRAAELDVRVAADSLGTLASLHVAQGNLDRAAAVYRLWAAQEPDNPVPAHLVRSCSADAPPERASDAYVAACFDGFAETFDARLGRLGYRAPELVAGALDAAYGPEEALGAVADLGCGTGLCAPFLRRRATRLVGVDLSAAMLDKARQRGEYDELVQAELTAFLTERPGAFDTLLSADTLCYFGDLDGFAHAARAALRPPGTLVFTVEQAEDVETFRLMTSGRYVHARSYVEESLTRSGFLVTAILPETLRLEAGEPVRGLVVTARRQTVVSEP